MKDFENHILILFAHPALQKSRVNKHLIRAIKDIDGVTFHDLYEAYPDFHILVRNEQELLVKNDIIVFHHPFFWCGTPAIIKEWQDLVLEHGWAYGNKGTALKGKRLLSVITTGGSESAYQKEGFMGYTMRELLAPIIMTANICGMHFLPPFIVHGTHKMTENDVIGHSEDYRRIIMALRDGRVDLDAAGKLPRLNTDIKAIIMK
jgi:glutathione-regulated potassium-efflux system ancillary protein KefG